MALRERITVTVDAAGIRPGHELQAYGARYLVTHVGRAHGRREVTASCAIYYDARAHRLASWPARRISVPRPVTAVRVYAGEHLFPWAAPAPTAHELMARPIPARRRAPERRAA